MWLKNKYCWENIRLKLHTEYKDISGNLFNEFVVIDDKGKRYGSG